MILVGNPEGKRPLGRPRHRWVANIKVDVEWTGFLENAFPDFDKNLFVCKSNGGATSYVLDGPGSVPASARFFPSLRSDRLWGSPNLLRSCFPEGEVTRTWS
jgi:hypothetical protein